MKYSKKIRRNIIKILKIAIVIVSIGIVAIITLVIATIFIGDSSNQSDNSNSIKGKKQIEEDIKSKFLKQWGEAYKQRDIQTILELHYFQNKKDYEKLEERLKKEFGNENNDIDLKIEKITEISVTSSNRASITFLLSVTVGQENRSGNIFFILNLHNGKWKISSEEIFPCLLAFSSYSKTVTVNTITPGSDLQKNLPETSVKLHEPAFIPGDPEIMEIIAKMTLEEKVGQLFMIGFKGQDISSVSDMIKEMKPGGIIIFKRNFNSMEQMNYLTRDLQSTVMNQKVKLLIASDQEGGKIVHIPSDDFPTNLEIGKKGVEYARAGGEKLAVSLKDCGLNMNLAPVLDLYNTSKIVGDRSFGSSKDLVAEMGLNMVDGIISCGIIPTIKHFPGHGATTVDSHNSLPLVEKKKSELQKRDFYPFQHVISQRGDTIVVMIAHIEYKDIDYGVTRPLPAVLSKKIVTDILRGEMGFNGVVMTDDLEMNAITDNYTTGDAAVEAIRAGVDLILICHSADSQWSAYDTLMSAVKKKKISEERINESVARILILKKRYGLLNII